MTEDELEKLADMIVDKIEQRQKDLFDLISDVGTNGGPSVIDGPPHPLYEPHCMRCGIKLSEKMEYICTKSDCSGGLQGLADKTDTE